MGRLDCLNRNRTVVVRNYNCAANVDEFIQPVCMYVGGLSVLTKVILDYLILKVLKLIMWLIHVCG